MQQWKAALAASAIGLGGMALGMQLTGSEPASAQAPTGYRECFFGQQEVVDIGNDGVVDTPPRARMIVVPRGYEAVGGGGNSRGDHGTILFCRR
jgi:hypothetical protein